VDGDACGRFAHEYKHAAVVPLNFSERALRHIDPVAELSRDLVSIQNPVRYLGGEFGQIVKDHADLTFALAFPDLYEIAMSNLAIKILYDRLNRIPSVRCERVFSPAPDFEELLKRKKLPLYTLESGIPVGEADILGVSIGYEPGITGLLSILETGMIPLLCSDRSATDPIVLAGGCGITNPAPFSKFIDAFFIGEAEAGLFDLVEELATLKKSGASRDDLLAHITAHPAVWTAEKASAHPDQVCARRAVYADFGRKEDLAVCFPVPHFRVVQDHGSVEIMRGCPNGCRFCHAGFYYRPQRMMDSERIFADVDYLVNIGGYREISLMSLSSGDYAQIDYVLSELTRRYSHRNVSFQLPSLKVNSFTLPLLEKMSEVRKSGLTFAIETPVDAWQLSLNKEVYRGRIIEILLEARRRGWNKAKFYFMIGLPVETEGKSEESEIVNFLLDIQDRTRIQCNANIGTFIPKPHTPYQWARQLSMEETTKKLGYIHGNLHSGRFKVNSPRPFNSFIEGMMSRGDERVGDIILEAYRRGCRLDAWDDWAKPDIWQAVVSEASWNVEAETTRQRSYDERLPWDGICLGPSKAFLRREMERSLSQVLTPKCESNCAAPCGVCGSKTSVKNSIPEPVKPESDSIVEPVRQSPVEAVQRVLVSFPKSNEAMYIPHLGLVEIWNKAFQRSGLPVMFTEGFNPQPRFELAQCMSIGIASDDEIGSFLLYEELPSDEILSKINAALPANLQVSSVFAYPLSRKIRRESLSRYFWGNMYRYDFFDRKNLDTIRQHEDFRAFVEKNSLRICPGSDEHSIDIRVPFSTDRALRDLIATIAGEPVYTVARIRKLTCLAIGKSADEPVPFFDAFISIAESNRKLLVQDLV
jgi:radical SAM family uncharacterized protein/radical SAM-linked protein